MGMLSKTYSLSQWSSCLKKFAKLIVVDVASTYSLVMFEPLRNPPLDLLKQGKESTVNSLSPNRPVSR